MTLATTSLKSYLNEIAPTLGARQIAILEVFERNPEKDYSNSELTEALGWKINQVTGRVKELRNYGILELSRERSCFVTGRHVSAWRIKAAPTISPRAIPAGKQFYQLPSRSNPARTHVLKDNGSTIACSCKGFYFRDTCSHVKRLAKRTPTPEETMQPLF